MPEIPLPLLRSTALEVGLSVAGITDVTPNEEARKRVDAWQQAGFAGEMAYMLRDSELFVTPRRLLPSARSVIAFSVAYSRKGRPERLPGYGLVARYAWGRDYHRVLKRRLGRLLERLRDAVRGEIEARYFTDAVPLLERAFAQRGGGGFVGKNTMLIQPGQGSFFLLAELVSNLRVVDEHELPLQKGSCGSCSRCLVHCPTGAFVKPHVLDARRCISYLTIEKRGELSVSERRMLGEWVFGCDVCQEVCPFNHRALRREDPPGLEEFSGENGPGPMIHLGKLLRIRSDEEFLSRFAGTPLMRAKREGLLRNAAAVTANTGAEEVVPQLEEAVHQDPSAVVRQHALWALVELAKKGVSVRALDAIVNRAAEDPDQRVAAEAQQYREGFRDTCEKDEC